MQCFGFCFNMPSRKHSAWSSVTIVVLVHQCSFLLLILKRVREEHPFPSKLKCEKAIASSSWTGHRN